jgi:hypothetical protein
MRRSACLPLGFVLLSASPAGARAPDSGIGGRIVGGPICPVESLPPVPGCAPRPLRATLRIRLVGRHDPSTSVRSAADGRFRVRLYPGTYVVQALAHAIRVAAPAGGTPRPGPRRALHARHDELRHARPLATQHSHLETSRRLAATRPRSRKPLGLTGASSTKPEVIVPPSRASVYGNVLLCDPSGAFRDVPRGVGPSTCGDCSATEAPTAP